MFCSMICHVTKLWCILISLIVNTKLPFTKNDTLININYFNNDVVHQSKKKNLRKTYKNTCGH